MKNAVKTILALATIALSVGCGLSDDDDSWKLKECPDGCESREQPQVEATFVSGHLGNYRDCPGEGYRGEAMSRDADAGMAACGPDSTDCESFMNCEDAQLTVQLTNTGKDTARSLQVASLELFDAEGTSRAVLPLMDTVDTSSNEVFDGELDVDEEITLRVTYLGPESPYTLLDTSSSSSSSDEDVRAGGGVHGTVEITFTSDNHDDVKTETTELYPVPSVDT